MIHAFTSINIAYLPKARVLAKSIKKWHPEVRLHLMLSDAIPDWFRLDDEDFDSVITPDMLGVDSLESWMFGHSVVELCTAVKPFAFRYIFGKFCAEKVFYFDPDCVLFSRFDALIDDLDRFSIVLTPHMCAPETTLEGIVDNETSCLRHGIYNLGFLAVRRSEEGLRLVDWWCERLFHFCHDNIPFGVFTDQRWMDFVPAFFQSVKIAREPQYNVATWNYNTRKLTGGLAEGVFVDGVPLCFHHFSGVDSGNALMMLKKYSKEAPVVWELNSWYEQVCKEYGQGSISATPWKFGFYDNGEKIAREDRLLFRTNPDLQDEFSHPFSTRVSGRRFGVSFFDWLQNNRPMVAPADFATANEPFLFFIQRTEQRLKGYVQQTKRLGRLGKTITHALVGGGFSIVRMILRLLGVRVPSGLS